MRLFGPGTGHVKICGITNEADALDCIKAGSDALGFNFFTGSSRHIPLESLEWIRKLNGLVDRVAVVVNAEPELLDTLWRSGCFEMIQFHGDESPTLCAMSGVTNWMKAIRVHNRESLAEANRFSTPHILLDSWSPAAYGGTGKTADWNLIGEFVAEHPEHRFVLAGGLNPGNVAESIRAVRPAAVDVAGGVEESPGRKDPSKVRDFIQAVRAAV
ncbi:MAG: phosphoribosylanthranilate isomerase [Terrimicrobiaceae bacterium]